MGRKLEYPHPVAGRLRMFTVAALRALFREQPPTPRQADELAIEELWDEDRPALHRLLAGYSAEKSEWLEAE